MDNFFYGDDESLLVSFWAQISFLYMAMAYFVSSGMLFFIKFNLVQKQCVK